MRIAILTNAYPPAARGGAGRIAHAYAEALTAQGHEVRVWGPDEAFGRLAATDAMSRLLFHIQDLKPRMSIVREMLAWGPHVLLTHNITGCGFGTPRRISRAGVPWFHVLHDVQLFEPSGRMMRGEPSFLMLRRAWREAWARSRARAMGEPNGVISPTQWLLDLHREYRFFRSVPSAVIPNPIPLSFPRPSRRAGESITSVSRDLNAVLFAGRLDTDKGVGVLYDAWPRMRTCVSKLILIGEGERRKTFDALKDEHVRVLGQLPPQEVMQQMASAGIVVVPSIVEENQSTVALEALVAGCHVVASDVGGMRETLAGCGELVTPGSASALADACIRLVGNPVDEEKQRKISDLLADHLPALAASRLTDFVTSNV